MAWQTYKEKLKSLAEALVKAQEPIRILNAINPKAEIREQFRKSAYKEIPKITPQDYSTPGDLDYNKKIGEFNEVKARLQTSLGPEDPYGVLMGQIADQYILVLEMLKARGTREFSSFSKRLYGSTSDHLVSDKNTVLQMSLLLYKILSGIKNTLTVPHNEKTMSAAEAVENLNQRFMSTYGDRRIEAVISDGIISDAAAGGDKIKLRRDAVFSKRDLDIFEVHEGWVHVGTTINGRLQTVAKWLSIGPPRCTSTQEGLAVLMEIFTFRTSVMRAQVINDRIIAVSKAEDGANLIDVFEYFRTEGYTEEDCIKNAFRVFRGGDFSGGTPFTKDISYCKGFVENYNFMRTAIRANKPFLIPFLFSGKVHVDDVPLIYKAFKEGIVMPPVYLPQQFADINGIAVWMSFSSFFNKVDLKNVQAHYNKLFSQYT